MGTNYKLIEKNGSDLSLDEHSGKLDLDFDNLYDDTCPKTLFGSLTPDDVLNIAITMIQTALYWSEDGTQAKVVERVKNLQC